MADALPCRWLSKRWLAAPQLKMAVNQLSLSARSFHRVLKVSRTIADRAGAETITASHLAEALQYRQRGTS